jgi:hypothetical protein
MNTAEVLKYLGATIDFVSQSYWAVKHDNRMIATFTIYAGEPQISRPGVIKISMQYEPALFEILTTSDQLPIRANGVILRIEPYAMTVVGTRLELFPTDFSSAQK